LAAVANVITERSPDRLEKSHFSRLKSPTRGGPIRQGLTGWVSLDSRVGAERW
jgi:hypothetical protein